MVVIRNSKVVVKEEAACDTPLGIKRKCLQPFWR